MYPRVTILPRHKAPGEHIEPHEYWIGKIIEIRADAESEDSRTVCMSSLQ